MRQRVILDTDIGTDVDDCLALAVLLASPEIALEGITCVYGDVGLRARMVLKLLELAGRTDIPVMLGEAEPLTKGREIYWAGHEGQGLLEDGEELPAPAAEGAVNYLKRTINEHPGELTLLAVGPLTNLAVAVQHDPQLVTKLAGLVIMGGVLRGPHALHLEITEHNIRCDPVAASVVFATPELEATLIPLDVTTKVVVRSSDLADVRAGGTPFHEAVADQLARFPRFQQLGYTYLHDPLAAAAAIKPDLMEYSEARIAVETSGDLTTGMTVMRQPTPDAPKNADVALTVATQEAERFIVQRLGGVLQPGA